MYKIVYLVFGVNTNQISLRLAKNEMEFRREDDATVNSVNYLQKQLYGQYFNCK
ncbi:MAG: hypothetical protein HKN75_11575 [Bacteroidia bacterium]|nr:hypothetical protein [Bacteroidia bacterium]